MTPLAATQANGAAAAPVIRSRKTENGQAYIHPYEIRMVAVDLDGTLLNSDRVISPRTLRALQAVQDQGVKIVIATARPPRSTRPFYKTLGIKTPTINYNGAMIWDEPTGLVLQHRPLSHIKTRQVIDYARSLFPEVTIGVEILDRWYTDHEEETPRWIIETAKTFSPDFVGPLDVFLVVPVTKLMLMGEPEWIDEIEESLPEKFGDTINHTRSDTFMLQILAPHVSKGAALQHVADRFYMDPRHIMAIGDAPNDIEMLKFAGLAVVVDNGWNKAKKHAHHVVPSNDHDGVALALERFVLRRGT